MYDPHSGDRQAKRKKTIKTNDNNETKIEKKRIRNLNAVAAAAIPGYNNYVMESAS